MSEQRSRAVEPLRELPIGCTRCLWTAALKPSVENPENYDITPLNGWEIGDENGALCDRCAKGWNPRIKEMQMALSMLEQWDMLTLDADGHGQATADAPWARSLIAKALRG